MRQAFAEGIAWGEAKKQLFELVNGQVGEAREKYEALLSAPKHIEDILQAGAEKARAHSKPMLEKLRAAVGLKKIQ